MKKVLVIGRSVDPHIIGITNELDKLNQNYFLLDTLTSSDYFVVKYSDGMFTSLLNSHGKEIHSNEISSVWNTSSLQISIQEDILEESRKFVESEWLEGINTLWKSIDVKWTNSPESISLAVNRLSQLTLAHTIGLTTPKSIITNNSDHLINFFEECNKKIIVKTLNSSKGLPKDHMIYTTKIEEKDFKNIEELRYSPCLFQEYIPKKTELRITVAGESINATEIHSQESEKTIHDWRRYDDFENTPYCAVKLPEHIEKKLLKLMKQMNLEFGAIDMIKTPTDDFIFLEVNPNGRWWWIQELTGINIARDIAKHLTTFKQ